MATQTDHNVSIETEISEQNKVMSLFQFIRELNKLKQKTTLDYKSYEWSCLLSDIPDDVNIKINYRDRVNTDVEELSEEDFLLSVHKPEFQKCPIPNEAIVEWLNPGWDDFHKSVSVKEVIVVDEGTPAQYESLLDFLENEQNEEGRQIITFDDDEKRPQLLNEWNKVRDVWVQQQLVIERTRSLFSDLYSWYFELQRESETKEIIVANGIIFDRDNKEIRHPVLTHRVKLDYDADKNTVYVLDADVPSELYSVVFQLMEGINLNGVNELSEDLRINDYHPLDRNDTPDFLKVLTHQLSSESVFSNNGIPEGWQDTSRILLYMEPCFIVRRRLDGTLKAIEQIIENVQATGEIPAPISDIVSGGTIDISDEISEDSIEEQLAAVGGESVEILLSKEANKEQLEIAKRIEAYNAVLVQGPPGTGKTHTIANLMGHFLAQGKSVLVTSHTTKALRVLKDKVAPGLQNLCVSMLDDSNIDMERSIEGISNYSSKTSSHELKREMDMLAVDRKETISRLADVRRKIFAIINQECNSIVYGGEAISPSKAAEFVVQNADFLSYIPGNVRINAPLPLSFSQLGELYRSNESISLSDEGELAKDIPAPDSILDVTQFTTTWNALQIAINKIENIANGKAWRVDNNLDAGSITIAGDFGEIHINNPTSSSISELNNFVSSFGKYEEWMKAAAVDGKLGGNYRQRWETLLDQIKNTYSFAETIITEQFGIDIQFIDQQAAESYETAFSAMKALFSDKGKIGKLSLMMHKDYGAALECVKIDGRQIRSSRECDIVLNCIKLNRMRERCSVYWNELLSVHGVPKFNDLDSANQERIVNNWIPVIQKYLDWYSNAYQPLIDKLSNFGINPDILFMKDTLDSDIEATEKILFAVDRVIPDICNICDEALQVSYYTGIINETKKELVLGKRSSSHICANLISAVEAGNVEAYSNAYSELGKMYDKYTLKNSRSEMLKTLEPVAPEWADAIRNRDGIHGQFTVPSDIEDAWKWKQLCGIVQEITEKPFAELQADSIRLSKEYRDVTALYAEKSGWYHLLKRTEADISMRQALQGWKLTVKKIGKGTGKQAPALKAKARELMVKCQDAVPGWIMPINRALESLNPKENRFDIIIIDEASQSDVSSLAILYMGRKLIIVGDDKQVSPMAVGVPVDKMTALEQMYIKDKIPNSHLYNAKSSIYDIAATTFQPLMLREHFRCVPEIIGFSNMLSYDYKIKPLRDASNSELLPAVVNYRVKNGFRGEKTKTNINEAKAIVALMKACMDEPEYKDKSFGIISLLGDEQVKVISRFIEQEIDPKEIQKRNILCGNSANFQGDERDVVFLSLVDSGNGNGPINLQGFGVDDAFRKRYNVAASRAKDQLWVVDSLDPANDLKPGDIRKSLIDYSINPQASDATHSELGAHAESPFELAVATSLSDRGYHLVQQWKVGAYRLDMVAVCGKRTVAIECDGERWHSGETKVREDMERQTILERLGWRFIRIRGSEYYRNPEATIERVISELTAFGIEPEENTEHSSESRRTELLNRVLTKAENALYQDESDEDDEKTIEAALNPKSMIPDNQPKEIKASTAAITASKPKVNTNNSTRIFESKTENEAKKNVGALPTEKPKKPEQMVTQGLGQVIRTGSNRKNAQKKQSKTNTSEITQVLEQYGFEYIDNASTSDIIWLISNKENKAQEEDVLKGIGYPYALEKRGTIATNNRRAWRIMLKNKEK